MGTEPRETDAIALTWDGLLAERIGPRLNAAESVQRDLVHLQDTLAEVTSGLRPHDLHDVAGLVPAATKISPAATSAGVRMDLRRELTQRRVPGAPDLARRLADEGLAPWFVEVLRSRGPSSRALEWLAMSALMAVSNRRMGELLAGIAQLRGVHRDCGPLVEPREDVDVVDRLRRALDLFRLEPNDLEIDLDLAPTPPVVGFPDELTDGFALLFELCVRSGARHLAVESATTAEGDASVQIVGSGPQGLHGLTEYDARKFALARRLISVCHDGRLRVVEGPRLVFFAWLPARSALDAVG